MEIKTLAIEMIKNIYKKLCNICLNTLETLLNTVIREIYLQLP